MPDRHESARLREEEEENPIENRQRLLEQRFGPAAAMPARGCPQQQCERGENAGAERAPPRGAMTGALIDNAIQEARRGSERFGAGDLPEQRKGRRVVRQQREVELEELARPRAMRVDDAQ